VGIEGARNASSLLRKDFRSAVSFLGLLELYGMAGLRPRRVLLHHTGTDLATATRSREVFAAVLRLASSRRMSAGVVSTNAGLLLPMLREWALPLASVATPVIASGYHMNPSRVAVEEALREFRGEVVAIYPGPAQDINGEDIEQARSVGAAAVHVGLFEAASAIRLQDLLSDAAP
jgi:hypothetical protein